MEKSYANFWDLLTLSRRATRLAGTSKGGLYL